MFTMLHSLIKATPTSFTRLHSPTGIDKRSSSNDLYICIQSKYIYQKITDMLFMTGVFLQYWRSYRKQVYLVLKSSNRFSLNDADDLG